ncbi:uncharacterized protein LOC112093140 [Morus notabilis]|uniref:uncharacterized protein LOC112093140 n=1 Tax=Morus notabilis TaxID=981085 RepID=UPI000CED3C11|nr:uncharacterized protein LOC112093140 [Morus notabilis]
MTHTLLPFNWTRTNKFIPNTELCSVNQESGGKTSHSGRPQIVTNASRAKSITTLDELKSRFPSEGLSTVSNKWWGSGFPDGYNERSENKEKNADPTTQGTGLLMDVRKRAAEEGRESLKLGVVRGFSAKKLGKREKALLLRMFKSSVPQDWISSAAEESPATAWWIGRRRRRPRRKRCWVWTRERLGLDERERWVRLVGERYGRANCFP